MRHMAASGRATADERAAQMVLVQAARATAPRARAWLSVTGFRARLIRSMRVFGYG
jgi:hypothetical protein